jgi:hypothetical protein
MGAGFSTLKDSTPKIVKVSDKSLGPEIVRDIRALVVPALPDENEILTVCIKTYDAWKVVPRYNRQIDALGAEAPPTFEFDDLRWTVDPWELHRRIGAMQMELQGILDSMDDLRHRDSTGVASPSLTSDEKVGRILAHMAERPNVRNQFERLRMRAYILMSMLEIQVYLCELPWYHVGRPVYAEEDLPKIIIAIETSTNILATTFYFTYMPHFILVRDQTFGSRW